MRVGYLRKKGIFYLSRMWKKSSEYINGKKIALMVYNGKLKWTTQKYLNLIKSLRIIKNSKSIVR